MKRFSEWHDSKDGFVQMLLFSALRESNRDSLGIWKMQFGVTIIIWCLIMYAFLTIYEAVK